MNATLLPCQHMPAEAYTEKVNTLALGILTMMHTGDAEHSGGACTAIVEDVIDQIVAYHLKLLKEQVNKEAAEAYLTGLLMKIKYHGNVVLGR